MFYLECGLLQWGYLVTVGQQAGVGGGRMIVAGVF